MDLGLKGLHVLWVGPVKQKQFITVVLLRSADAWNPAAVWYLTMPAALPLALAWAYKFLATVFSFTEPTNVMPFTFLQQKRKVKPPVPSERLLGWMDLDSHGEVGDESSFGDLDIEANTLGFGAWIDHRAPDGGVSEARRDPALHLVALDSDVISTDGLW